MRRSCALNATYVQVPFRKQWSCAWISSSQECVSILQGMRCTSWDGCGCSPSWNGIPDRGPDREKHSRSDCLLFRIARFGALDGLNKQNSKEDVDSRGRRCIRQSLPQFRCTSRDGSFGVHDDSNDPRAWRLRTTRLDTGLNGGFRHKSTNLLRWLAQPTALALALDPSLREYGGCCVGVPRHDLPDIPPLLRAPDSESSRAGGCPCGRRRS